MRQEFYGNKEGFLRGMRKEFYGNKARISWEISQENDEAYKGKKSPAYIENTRAI